MFKPCSNPMFAESTCFSMIFDSGLSHFLWKHDLLQWIIEQMIFCCSFFPNFPHFSLVFIHIPGSDAAHAGTALQPSEQSAALGRGAADLCGAAAGGAAPGEAENDGTRRGPGKHSRALDSGKVNGNSGILKWRPIFCGDIPLHRPYIGLIYDRYLQFRFLKWPLIKVDFP